MKFIISGITLMVFMLFLTTIFNSDKTVQATTSYQLIGTATVTLTSTPRPMITFPTKTPTVTPTRIIFTDFSFLPIIIKNR